MKSPNYDAIAEWYDEFTRSAPWNDAALTALLSLLPDVSGLADMGVRVCCDPLVGDRHGSAQARPSAATSTCSSDFA